MRAGRSLFLLFVPMLMLRAARAPVEARHGLVSSAHVLASQAGLEIMRKGGNAVDAAVATGFALEVVYPFAGNLGGGGFMMIRPADGRMTAIDYRETAPASASRDMYLRPDRAGLIHGPGSSILGWRASGVPGTVAGFALALRKYGSGKVTWAEVIEPARRLAANGHVVSQAAAASLRFPGTEARLAAFPDSKRIYLNGGRGWHQGDLWRQPELAATLARIQKYGPGEFYRGETARLIAGAMKKNGGTITLADLAGYRALERAPLVGHYRGHEIVTMPPPSSGGICLLEMLSMLEPFDVRSLGYNSAAKYHLFIEVMRRAFHDRSEYLGDPDFIQVPTAGLLEPARLKRLMANFDLNRATPSSQLPYMRPAGWESRETTQFTVVDSSGCAVSNTYTLNGGFGSAVTIPGAGFLMNNEMDDFAAWPGRPNMFGLIQGEANAISPGKRPLSSMTPTFVLRGGRLLLATGSPGGPTIINTVLEVVTNIIDHQMPVALAVDAARFHHQWMPDVATFEPFALSPDTEKILVGMGHKIATHANFEGSYQGDAETIFVDPNGGMLMGAADPRKPDARAVGF